MTFSDSESKEDQMEKFMSVGNHVGRYEVGNQTMQLDLEFYFFLLVFNQSKRTSISAKQTYIYEGYQSLLEY